MRNNTSIQSEVRSGGKRPWDDIPSQDIRRQMRAIISSSLFARSVRMKRFLRFIVEQTLNGKSHLLKEYSIAVEVYDKSESFDARLDPIVRVEAGRLRAKLREYYDQKGRHDPVHITLPKRTYVPVFRRRNPKGSFVMKGLPNASLTSKALSQKPATGVHPATFSVPGRLRSIAVLPFADLSRKKDQEYFCDGLTEELTHALNGMEGLLVVSRTSGNQFKVDPPDIREIGRQLNADIVLEGSVRKQGKKRRVTLQLISVEEGYNFWSHSADYQTEDIFAIQEQAAAEVIQALKTHSSKSSWKHQRKRGTEIPEAYELYLRGRHYWNKRSEKMLIQSIDCLKRAVQLDPQYAHAYAGLADSYASLAWLGAIPPQEGWDKGCEAARTALRLNDSLSQAHASLGCLQAIYERQWKMAEKNFQVASKIDPVYPTAHHWYALFCLTPQRQLDQALFEIQQARNLDPISPVINSHLGWILYFRRQFNEAAEQLKKTIQLAPDSYLPRWHLGFVFSQLRSPHEALVSFNEAHALGLGQPVTLAGLGYCYGILGEREKALKVFQQLKKISRRKYISPLDLSLIQLGLGEVDNAFEWLNKASDEHCSRLIHLKVDPAFDELKLDSRFDVLLNELSLRN